MELFSELYGCYYQTVKKILKKARLGISEQKMKTISDKTAFTESSFYILPKLLHGNWNLLTKKEKLYYSKTKKDTPCYLTTLQNMFIKSLLNDRKIKLFLTDSQIQEIKEQLYDIEPLFSADDFHYFDQFKGGDPYEDTLYIKHFRIIHKAICEHKCLNILYKNNITMQLYLPKYLEYSAKDDKFRLYAIRLGKKESNHQVILNLALIKEVQQSNHCIQNLFSKDSFRCEKVTFFIFNERNALERCTLQFSSYKKQIRYLEDKNCYECTMYYDKTDEKEIVIRLLSFGPLIQIIAPDNFVGIIKKRVSKQHRLLTL